ncbi:hypothetical protein POTOM_003808 [Populus tomentosa]|uniref:Uncharacterized protein n=1 Tax=Populus tomentosa TaxID=118781 RepID=A0A8X8AE76_POPTO|nr:hypothetical protein POTOM_003808 [Populus tomentosa]
MKNSQTVSTLIGAEKREYFQDFIEEEEEEEEEDVGLACPPFDEEDFTAAKASYSDLSEEVFFSRIDNDQKSSEIPVEGSSGNLNAVQIKQKRHGNGKDMKWNVLNRPWEFHKFFITASRFSYAVGSVKCSHVSREGNCMADALAKEGAGVLKSLRVYGIQSSWLNEVMNLGDKINLYLYSMTAISGFVLF